MLLDSQKTKGLDELLAIPAVLAVLRELVGSTHTPEVRLGAAKILVDLWTSATGPEERQARLIEYGTPQNGRARHKISEEELAEQLMKQLSQEDSLEDGDESEGGAATDLLDSAPVKEKPASPAAKAKPKPSRPASDEEAEPRINPRYFVALSVLSVLLLGMLIVSWTTGPASPAALAKRALSAAKEEDRIGAVVELALRKDPGTLDELFRVASESQDGEVVARALNGLPMTSEPNILLVFKNLNHPDRTVRQVAAQATQKYYSTLPQDLEYAVDDPADKRADVAGKLKDFYKGAEARVKMIEAKQKQQK